MSARQRARLSNTKQLKKHQTDSSESEDEDEFIPSQQKKSTFMLMSDASSSDETDSDSESVNNAETSAKDGDASDNPDPEIPTSTEQVRAQRGGRNKMNNPLASDPDPVMSGDAGASEEQVDKKDEEHELLDAILREREEELLDKQKQQSSRLLAAYDNEIIRRELLFNIDTRSLDVDAVQRRRFGAFHDLIDGAAAPAQQQQQHHPQQRGIARRNNNIHLGRKFMFGQPKEGWVKPPAFGLGGIGMEKGRYARTIANNQGETINESAEKEIPNMESTPNSDCSLWFRFTWSKEFEFLTSQYEVIERSGDINLIVMFLAHFPYHPRAFLQLAALYARTGRMDRATDLIRRVLYIFECATLEALKPNIGKCQMDPTVRENNDYFEALFRHVLFSAMQGCFSVAADVSRFILSLHPKDDRFSLLLMLDTFLVAAGRYDTILDYCGIKGSVSQTKLPLASTFDIIKRVQQHIEHGYDLDEYSQLCADGQNERKSPRAPTVIEICFRSSYQLADWKLSTDNTNSSMNLADLPNWWFSLALSLFLAEETEQNTSAYNESRSQGSVLTSDNTLPFRCPSNTKISSLLLQAALIRWPFMLLPLLHQCDISVGLFTATSSSAPWQSVLTNAFFRDAEQRLVDISNNIEGRTGRCCLVDIANVYAIRSASLWKRDVVLQWLRSSCVDTIGQMRQLNGYYTEQQILDKHTAYYTKLLNAKLSKNPLVEHYSNIQREDFMEELPRFPNDMDPIEPQLQDPELFAGAVRFQDFMDDTGRFLNPRLVAQQHLQQNGNDEGAVNRHGLAMGVMARRAERQMRRWWAAAIGNDDNEEERAHPHDEADMILDQLVQQQQRRESQRPQSYIDLNLPLLQLFIATLFPWVHVSSPAARR